MCVVQKPEEQYKVMLRQVGLPRPRGRGRGVTWGEGPMEGPEGPGWRGYGSIFVLRLWGGGCWCPWEPGTDVGADGVPAWRSGYGTVSSLRCSVCCEAGAGPNRSGSGVGLSPGPLREHPGTRSRATRCRRRRRGTGLHSNGLCFPDLAGPAGPGWGKGGEALTERREARGRQQSPLGQGTEAPGPRRHPAGAIGATPLRSGPAQANGGLPGLRGLG